MVQAALVAPNLPGGAHLLDVLPQVGLSVVDSFWYPSASRGRWRLVLSLLEREGLGLLAAYEAVQHALVKVPELNMPLEDIVLAAPSDLRVEQLRNALPAGSWQEPYSDVVWFQESMAADGTMVPVYVYRLRSKAARQGIAV